MKLICRCWVLITLTAFAAQSDPAFPLWELAQTSGTAHRFSTLFTAQDVRQHLAIPEKLSAAVAWCKETGVTRVYLETFRDGYQAERAALEQAKDRFLKEGFIVSGCVTPTRVGKPSTGWKNTISCYTDGPTQQRVKEIFEYTAALFDEIMIDDFWFTDCACPPCEAARASQLVVINDKTFPVAGESWEEYRGELMLQLSRLYVLAASKSVNPKARLIIKYPQWYDNFHERGYDVARETRAFDQIWVGTETRDYDDKRWGGTVQYEAYFIMRWLGGIGGAKSGGGWYDWLGTTERTYLEQARQTVLAGARESMLFCYGGLQRDTGPKNVEVLRQHIPELWSVARKVSTRPPVGLAAYKPANSHPGNEKRVFDFVGMLGLPLLPTHEFPTNAPAAFFSIHALKDSNLVQKLTAYIARGRPVLLTDGLADALSSKLKLDRANVRILKLAGDPKTLLDLPQTQLDPLRNDLLKPLKTSFAAPNRVALYLFSDASWVIENFNEETVKVRLNQVEREIPGRGWLMDWR